MDMLNSVQDHIDDNEFLSVIGQVTSTETQIENGRKEFGILFQRYAGWCKGCPNSSPKQYLPTEVSNYVNKVVDLAKKFRNKNGVDIFIEARKAYYSQVGAWHAMRHMENLDYNDVKWIDASFEEEGKDACENCRYDVELITQNEGDLRYIEYKSYIDASKIPRLQLFLFKVN